MYRSFFPTFSDILDDVEKEAKSNVLKNASNDKEYTLEMVAVGLGKNDISITIENGVISISGEKKTDTYSYKISERFTLPDDADQEKVEASAENGILTVKIPKKKKDVKKISVEIK